jgi:epoxyqueuosine reductase
MATSGRLKVWILRSELFDSGSILDEWVLSAWTCECTTDPICFQRIGKQSSHQLEESLVAFKSRLETLGYEAYFWGTSIECLNSIKSPHKGKVVCVPDHNNDSEVSRAQRFTNLCVSQVAKNVAAEFPEFPWDKMDSDDAVIAALKMPHLLPLFNHKDARIKKLLEKAHEKPKLLLHVCCGPDAAGVIGQLKRDFEVTCFWYDPNIQPREEYDLRLDAFKKVAEIENVPYIEGEYDVNYFLERIRGFENSPETGAKCSICYDLRLDRSAHEAKKLGFDTYATTLAISPHKVQEKLIKFGELNQKRYGVPYYHKNFMKDEGFKKSVEYTRDYNIYRQDYCGCWFSLHEGGPRARATAKAMGLEKGATSIPANI